MTKPVYAEKQTALNHVKAEKLMEKPDWSPRYDYGDMKGLKSSIESLGVQVPLIVQRTPKGELYIINGHRRYRAVLSLAEKGKDILIPITLTDKEDTDTSLMIKFLATVTYSLQPYEEAVAFLKLMDWGATAKEVASSLGVTVAYVTDRLKLIQAVPSVIEQLKKGELPLATVQRIVTMAAGDKEKQEELLQKELVDKGALKDEQEQAKEEAQVNRVRLKRENIKNKREENRLTLKQAKSYLLDIVDSYSDMVQSRLPINKQNKHWKKMQNHIIQVRNLKKEGVLRL